MNDQESRETELALRVAAALGRSSVRLETLSPGTSRGAVRVLSEEGAPIAFLRVDLGANSAGGDGLTFAEEIGVVRRAFALGFPVPEVYALFEDPAVAVMELARGTARPEPAEAERVGPEFMEHIARLHGMDPGAFGLDAPPTITAAITQDLDQWVADADRRGITGNILARLAIRILRHTLPKSEARPAMLHGDVGAGNFMVEDGKVSAILDWELAHAGDIHEDLAWLWIRGAHTEFGDPRRRIAEYEAAAGVKLVPDRLAWHVAFVTFKSVIGLQRRMYATGDDPGLLMTQIGVLTYEALLCAALAKLVHAELTLLDEAPATASNVTLRLLDRLGVTAPPTTREGEIILCHLRDSAAQSEWEARRLREDARARLQAYPDDLGDLVDHAPPERFAALLEVIGAAAGRRCRALPNAERRVRRALSIGLGQ